MKGEHEKAWNIIRDLHSRPENTDHSYARAKYEQIRQQIEINKSMRVGYKGMFTRRSYLKRVLIGCGLIFFLEASETLVINSEYQP